MIRCFVAVRLHVGKRSSVVFKCNKVAHTHTHTHSHTHTLPRVFSEGDTTHRDEAWSSRCVGRPWWLLRRERRNVGGPDGSGTCWAWTRERWATVWAPNRGRHLVGAAARTSEPAGLDRSWVGGAAPAPDFPGAARDPDPSSKATLWVKAQHEGALPPPCTVRKDPRVENTARRGA